MVGGSGFKQSGLHALATRSEKAGEIKLGGLDVKTEADRPFLWRRGIPLDFYRANTLIFFPESLIRLIVI